MDRKRKKQQRWNLTSVFVVWWFVALSSSWTVALAISDEEIAAVVEASPFHVANHDRDSWLDLFAQDAVVEDPVGSVRSQGRDRLDEFYSIFIETNDIRFKIINDYIVGKEMIRDVHITTDLGDDISVTTPAYLRYRVIEEEDGKAYLYSLNAHWEILPQTTSLISQSGGLQKSLALFGRMLEEWGVWRTIQYTSIFASGVFGRGKHRVRHFAEAVNESKVSLLTRQFSSKEESVIHFKSSEQSYSVTEFTTLMSNTVVSNVQFSDLRSGGWFCSGRFTLKWEDEQKEGVAFFEFDRRSLKIKQVDFYWDALTV